VFPSFVDAQSLCTCCDHSPEGSFRKAVSKSCVSLNASSESSLVVSMLSLHERVVIEVLRCRLGGSEFPSLPSVSLGGRVSILKLILTAMTHCTTSHCFLLSLLLFVNAAHQSLEGDLFLHINHQYKHVQTSPFQFLDEHLSNLRLILTAIFDCTTSHCFYLSLHLFANVAHQSLESTSFCI